MAKRNKRQQKKRAQKNAPGFEGWLVIWGEFLDRFLGKQPTWQGAMAAEAARVLALANATGGIVIIRPFIELKGMAEWKGASPNSTDQSQGKQP